MITTYFSVEDILLSYGNQELYEYVNDIMMTPYLHGNTNANLFRLLLWDRALNPVTEVNLFTPQNGMSILPEELAKQFEIHDYRYTGLF